MAQLIKNMPAMRETWVGSLGWEYRLEKGTATRVLENSMDCIVLGVTKSRIRLSDFHIFNAYEGMVCRVLLPVLLR